MRINDFKSIFGEFDIPEWIRCYAVCTDDAISNEYHNTNNYREYAYSCLISCSYYPLKFKFENPNDYNSFINVLLETIEAIPIRMYSFPSSIVFGVIFEYSVKYEHFIDVNDYTTMGRLLKSLISFQGLPYISMLDPIQLSSYLSFVIKNYNLSKHHIEMFWYILVSDNMLQYDSLTTNLRCKHTTSEKILNRMKLTGKLNLSPEDFLNGK